LSELRILLAALWYAGQRVSRSISGIACSEASDAGWTLAAGDGRRAIKLSCVKVIRLIMLRSSGGNARLRCGNPCCAALLAAILRCWRLRVFDVDSSGGSLVCKVRRISVLFVQDSTYQITQGLMRSSIVAVTVGAGINDVNRDRVD
jgi:hypothetical protein